jgi:hypothetical protein
MKRKHLPLVWLPAALVIYLILSIVSSLGMGAVIIACIAIALIIVGVLDRVGN